ncbi:Nucleoside-diphosphate-sugar epimerase [Actinopolyspora xinjiangensis]|uniref:Nucleoside-diphosphate-sugar epimerase n=1 Tax=Actinopolyspora xinjiangensis TaxID=405564 RepID=A0A1H0V9E7_9ACTN|nr:NAD(P)-dependent oxidoreductase [Actinopolyspora xinjiangensis]SDP75070.1 Nucleoside-diphosphate-sugar epimerase [Actinopolyspora xinjiangensis]
MTSRILLTGASGFIGSRVARALTARPDFTVRLLHRGESPREGAETESAARLETVRADLTDPDSLRGVCDGVDAVVHLASLVSGGPEACAAVNTSGTRALVGEALRTGRTPRIIYLSTAAVYGRGPFRDAGENDLPLAPSSARSRTRADAEREVLNADGIVLRPHLVYGTGDRWVVPALVELREKLDGGMRDWRTRMSLIDADDIARVIATAVSAERIPGDVYHLNHPSPVECAELMNAVDTLFPPRRGGPDLDSTTARERLRGDERALHDLEMVLHDHWFAGDRIWRDLDLDPGPGFGERFSNHLAWYRRLLSTPAVGVG